MNNFFCGVFVGLLFQFYIGGCLVDRLLKTTDPQAKILTRLDWIGITLTTLGLMYLWNLPAKP